jgi:hypothetical protein
VLNLSSSLSFLPEHSRGSEALPSPCVRSISPATRLVSSSHPDRSPRVTRSYPVQLAASIDHGALGVGGDRRSCAVSSLIHTQASSPALIHLQVVFFGSVESKATRWICRQERDFSLVSLAWSIHPATYVRVCAHVVDFGSYFSWGTVWIVWRTAVLVIFLG